jgi:hypothetical protein
MSESTHDINNKLISLYATLDSWCDLGHQALFTHTDGQVHRTLHSFILESRLLLGAVDCGGEISAHRKIEYASMLHDIGIEDLRKELRQLLFEYLCLLERLHDSPEGNPYECLAKVSNLITASQKKISVLEVQV